MPRLNGGVIGADNTPTPTGEKTLLLLHGEGANQSTTFINSVIFPGGIWGLAEAKKYMASNQWPKPINSVFTVSSEGSPAISTTQKKFGSSSIYFPSTPYSRLVITGDITIGTGDFTVETWYYLDPGGNEVLWTFGTSNWLYNGVWINPSRLVYWSWNGSYEPTTTTLTSTTWHHIAYVRQSGQSYLYINGTKVGGPKADTLNLTYSKMYIGNQQGASNQCTGYMDEFRVSKVARYTSNFTPLTTAFIPD